MRLLIFSVAFAFGLGLIAFQAAARIATDSTGVRNSNTVTAADIKVEVPEVIIQDVAVDVKISFKNSRHNLLQDNNCERNANAYSICGWRS